MSTYTSKIKIPKYEPKKECPKINDLYDTSERDYLVSIIEKDEKIPSELKDFFISSADRFIVFNHSKIAEFYSHSDIEVKLLFEDNILVLLDYDKAQRKGLIRGLPPQKFTRESYINQIIDEITDETLIKKYKDELNFITSKDFI